MITGFRRSLLYVPCDSPKMLAKCAALDADVLLLNLEDGISAAKKDEARANVCEVLRTSDFGRREVIVRVNSLDTPCGAADLEAVVPLAPDGVCIPKVERDRQVLDADRRISEMEDMHGVELGTMRLHAMIESPAGVMRALAIGSATGRLASFIFGSADYVAEARCRPAPDRSELLFALQAIVTAAHACNLDAIDSPCFDLPNLVLLRQEAGQARRLGFDGKSALHPGQLETINDVFSVTEEEVRWAESVLSRLDTAEEGGRALTTMDGHLIDNPHRLAAENILRRRR